jgi:hypothetical protein
VEGWWCEVSQFERSGARIFWASEGELRGAGVDRAVSSVTLTADISVRSLEYYHSASIHHKRERNNMMNDHDDILLAGYETV